MPLIEYSLLIHKEDIENALRVNEKLQYDISGTNPVLKFLKDNERNDEFDSFQSIKSVEKLVGKKVLIIHGEHNTAIPSNVFS
ncbi:Protein of unknown function [Pyronema omphalodes CBS 100304]|uniref:Uncharacterized protein n=1 Tax=Pyronema omphalodes (strain CBS 100304) TaxID=1076935 RepID=U4LL50_PYROM|nr:Protein of unknown function [Pyronema omphalodes CBS 100304]